MYHVKTISNTNLVSLAQLLRFKYIKTKEQYFKVKMMRNCSAFSRKNPSPFYASQRTANCKQLIAGLLVTASPESMR